MVACGVYPPTLTTQGPDEQLHVYRSTLTTPTPPRNKHPHVQALKDGFSVSLYPGGSKEIYTTNPYTAETKLVLRIRQGFIKLALHYGAPLVPIYIYGEKCVRTNPLSPSCFASAQLLLLPPRLWSAMHPAHPIRPYHTHLVHTHRYAYHRLEQKTGFGNLLLSTLRVPFLVFWGRWCTFLPLRGTQVCSMFICPPVHFW